MGADFKLDKDFEAGAKATTEVRDLIQDAVDRSLAAAAPNVPTDTEDLLESLYGDVALTADGWQGRIGYTDFKGAWKEFGTVREPAQPALRNAVMQEVGNLDADTGQDAN